MSRPLHIAIDARWIFPEISGIGLYTQELIAALARLTTPHRFTLIFNHAGVRDRTAADTGFAANASFTTVMTGRGPYSPADQLLLPALLHRHKVDVFHATNLMLPLCGMGRIKRVMTVHDLIPLLFRDHAPRSKKNRLFPVYYSLVYSAAKKADLIIAVSEHTRRDVENRLLHLTNRNSKVRVVHEGVRPAYTPAPKPVRSHVEFLFVGRRDPYKNLPMLIRSFAELIKLDLPVRLRIVGGDDPRYPEARDIAKKLDVDRHIAWSGYVPETELISAYQQADVFVLPSRYEGFGLPVLEAMACGTPVICSNCSSLPEVAGNAALLIDPDHPASLTDAMIRVTRDASLRSVLARRGIAQAATFTWEKTARMTMAAYELAAT